MNLVKTSNYSNVGGKYILNVTYQDGTGESKSFDTEEATLDWLTKQEEKTMADKNNDKTTNTNDTQKLDTQDPHVNAPGELHETPEKAASDMSLEEAEAINSNVNPAPVPGGANVNSTNAAANNLDADSENGSGNVNAPHEMGVSDKPSLGQQVKENV